MRKNNDEIQEQILRDNLSRQQQNNQDDVSIHSIEKDGVEVPIVERRREIEYTPTPDGNGVFPITVNRTKYRLDDTGQSFGKISDVASCRFGCLVNARKLLICTHCHAYICIKHIIMVGNQAYCNAGLCGFIGKIRQYWRGICQAISSHPGDKQTQSSISQPDYVSEKDFFPSSPNENIDLIKAEKDDKNNGF